MEPQRVAGQILQLSQRPQQPPPQGVVVDAMAKAATACYCDGADSVNPKATEANPDNNNNGTPKVTHNNNINGIPKACSSNTVGGLVHAWTLISPRSKKAGKATAANLDTNDNNGTPKAGDKAGSQDVAAEAATAYTGTIDLNADAATWTPSTIINNDNNIGTSTAGAFMVTKLISETGHPTGAWGSNTLKARGSYTVPFANAVSGMGDSNAGTNAGRDARGGFQGSGFQQ